MRALWKILKFGLIGAGSLFVLIVALGLAGVLDEPKPGGAAKQAATGRQAAASNPEQKVLPDSFATLIANTGCSSRYTDEKKADIFASRYRNHRMIFSGTIAEVSAGSVSLKIMPDTLISDIDIHFRDPRAGYNLVKGQRLTVVARLTAAGGCIANYKADQGEIRGEPMGGTAGQIAEEPSPKENKFADVAAIKPAVDHLRMAADWQKVEITEAKHRAYDLTLWYKAGVLILRGQPAADARRVARTILAALIKQERSPATEQVSLFVWVMQHARGVTGAKLVREYGYASYDYNDDSLSYTACTGKSWFGC